MNKLTVEQQIKVLENVIKELEGENSLPYLCRLIPNVTFELGLFGNDMLICCFETANSLIPIFKPENAQPFSTRKIGYINQSWFEYDDPFEGRINFCSWMIKQLKEGGSHE